MSLTLFTRDLENGSDRPALLLLPPFPFDHRIWDALAQRLTGYPLISVDPPGFGASKMLSDAPALEVYADALAASLRSLGQSRVVVAGSSMGGYVALALLERHPEMVAGLAMVGSHAHADPDQARDRRTELAISAMMGRAQKELAAGVDNLVSDHSKKHLPELIEMAKDWVLQAPDEAIAWAARAMAIRPERLGVLRASNVPILILRGSEDSAASAQNVAEMAEAARVQVQHIDQAGHLLPLEVPGVVARALIELLAKVD